MAHSNSDAEAAILYFLRATRVVGKGPKERAGTSYTQNKSLQGAPADIFDVWAKGGGPLAKRNRKEKNISGRPNPPSYKSVIYPSYKSVIYPGRAYKECNLPQVGNANSVIHPRLGLRPIGTYKAYIPRLGSHLLQYRRHCASPSCALLLHASCFLNERRACTKHWTAWGERR